MFSDWYFDPGRRVAAPNRWRPRTILYRRIDNMNQPIPGNIQQISVSMAISLGNLGFERKKKKGARLRWNGQW
jgi:hypothetical protein